MSGERPERAGELQHQASRKLATNELLLGLDYTYNTPGINNYNGNVASQTIRVGATTISQGYSYDTLNRLTGAIEPRSWAQNYI